MRILSVKLRLSSITALVADHYRVAHYNWFDYVHIQIDHVQFRRVFDGVNGRVFQWNPVDFISADNAKIQIGIGKSGRFYIPYSTFDDFVIVTNRHWSRR